MPGPQYHARTHLPGGTDPLPINLPMVFASSFGAGNQTVTTTAELKFAEVPQTNDQTTFAFDPADPYGVVIMKTGWYAFYAVVNVTSSYLSVPRSIYISCQPVGSGTGVFGNGLGEGAFFLGTGQGTVGDAGADATNSKGTLNYQAITSVYVPPVPDPPDNYGRATVVLQHSGSDYVVGNIASTLTIVRLTAGELSDTTVPLV